MIAPRLRDELTTRAAWAQRYAALSWPILPTHGISLAGECTCQSPRCDRAGKHPARKRYREMATTDPDMLASYWRLVPFNLSLLIPVGLLVLDVDDVSALAPLARFGAWPVTPTHSTTRGWRMVFRWPLTEPAPTLGGLDRTKLDILGTDALCILPPSVAASGHRYSWRSNESPWDVPLADVPAEFAGHLLRISRARASARRKDRRAVITLDGALALAMRRARLASCTSNGTQRGAVGLRRTLQEAGAAPGIVAAALEEYHVEARS